MRRWNCLSSSSNKRKTIQNKIDHLWEILSLKEDDYYCLMISLPFLITYVSDRNHFETTTLKRKYREQSKCIAEVLYADDWFEQILTKLKN